MENLKEAVKRGKLGLYLTNDQQHIFTLYEYMQYLKRNDIRNYIRLKTLIYYFPSVTEIGIDFIKRALNNSKSVRLVLDEDEYSYEILDNFYRNKYNREPNYEEFLTIDEFCEVFGI